MAHKVFSTPQIPDPPPFTAFSGVLKYLLSLKASLVNGLSRYAYRINLSLPMDGTEPMTGPLAVAAYAKADLPDATATPYGLVGVTDETGGATVAFSDGTNWRRVQDRAVVS